VTRQKLKEAYAAEFAATIERAEKQIILARHGRRLLNLLDDTPIIPGNTTAPFEHANQARQILNDAEDDLRDYTPELEEVISNSNNLDTKLIPKAGSAVQSPTTSIHSNGASRTISTTSTAKGPASPNASASTANYAPSEAGTSQVA